MWIKGIYKSLIRVFGYRLIDSVLLTGLGYAESCLICCLYPLFLSKSNAFLAMLIYLLGITIGAYFCVTGLDILMRGED